MEYSSSGQLGRSRTERAQECQNDGHRKCSASSRQRRDESRENSSFAPLGLELFSALHPRLTAWAAFFRGFAAKIRCSTSKARVHISQIVDIWGGPSFCWAADGGCPYEISSALNRQGSDSFLRGCVDRVAQRWG